ncbi:MAG: exodeoxyribonuclease III [Nanoarchaeota archaeon]
MKFLSWNVNGIRAVQKAGFIDFVKEEDPDVLCVQEIKADALQAPLALSAYQQVLNPAGKKGYAGTAIFSREKPLSIQKGMGISEHDTEGRLITLEYPTFYLVNVYTPNSQRGLARLQYKITWDKAFLTFVATLDKKKPVIMCGDFNCAHQEIDIARPKENRKNAGFTDEEREDFSRLLSAGFIDTFRHMHPDKVEYSWWSYMFNARAKNIGWRIDYFLMSKQLQKRLQEAFILTEIKGSDHAPVGIILDH